MNSPLLRQVAVVNLAILLGMVALMALMHVLGAPHKNPLCDVYYHLYFRFEPTAGVLLFTALCAAFFLSVNRPIKVAPAFFITPSKVIIAAAFFVLLTWAGTHFIALDYPLSQDEYSAFFQSEIFAAGRVWADIPKDLVKALWPASPQFFVTSVEKGYWHGGYWPWHSFLMVPFTVLGQPQLYNPLMGAATLWLFAVYLRERFASPQWVFAGLLFAVSSLSFVFMSITFYSWPSHLFFNLLFVMLLKKKSPRHDYLAGLVGSVALGLHQFVPHFCFALPWCIDCAARGEWKKLVRLVVGYLPGCVLVLVGWFWLCSQGDMNHHMQGAVSGGWADFVVSRLRHLGFHVPNIGQCLFMLLPFSQIVLWSHPAMFPLALRAVFKKEMEREDMLWAASFALTFGIYIFAAFTPGHGWGYRYIHSAWFALPVLGVSAMRHLVKSGVGDIGRMLSEIVWIGAISVLFMLPFRCWEVRSFVEERLAPMKEFTGFDGIVFVAVDTGWYYQDYTRNDPFLKSRPIFLHSQGADADRALASKLGLPYRHLVGKHSLKNKPHENH